MEAISKNISYKEATFSPTAVRKGIDNTPDKDTLSRMQLVAERCFEPIRTFYGKPIKINSFYRCEILNKEIGGSDSSQHCSGEAIDIDADKDNLKIFNWILQNLDFDQLIYEFGNEKEPDWIHISYTEQRANRNQVLKAIKENGKTVYKKY